MTNENHNFTWAIEQLKAGKKVRRPMWGKDSYWIIGEPDEKITWMNKKDAVIHINQVLANDWEVVKIPECLFDKVIYSDKGHEHDTLLVNDVFESLNKIRNFIKNKRLPIFNPEEIFSQVKYNNNLTEIIAFMDKELVGRKI